MFVQKSCPDMIFLTLSILLLLQIVGGNFDLELCYDIRDPFDVLAILDLFDRISTKAKVSAGKLERFTGSI